MGADSYTLSDFTQSQNQDQDQETQRDYDSDQDQYQDQDVDLQQDRGRFRPEEVLVFDAHGTAHFRRVEGNSTAQTYRIPPKTTVAGMVSGMVGHPHDSYYDLFRAHNSAIAVIPKSSLRTQTKAFIQPNTDDQNHHVVSVGPDEAITLPRTWGEDRKMQRNPYAYLFNVSYRVVIGLADTETYTALREALKTRRYEYTPCLGRRECGAEIVYRGACPVDWIETKQVDSAIPDSGLPEGTHASMLAVQDTGTVIDTERSPAEMVAEHFDDPAKKSTRKTIEWETWTVQRDGNQLTLSDEVEAARIPLDDGGEDDETVVFA